MPDELRRYGRAVASVFDLLGHGEVDLTAALGWTLSQSPTLLDLLWKRLGLPSSPDGARIDLEVADGQGRTDLEIANDHATVIIEAKKGWLVPGETQLAKYVPRMSGAPHPVLVSLSDSSASWAATQLGVSVQGIPVRHLPWDSIRNDLRSARRLTRTVERHWLEELTTYLAGATAVRDPAEQWVYCVVVSNDAQGGPRTFRDYVTTERRYFHPFGGRNGWPKRPPTSPSDGKGVSDRSTGLSRARLWKRCKRNGPTSPPGRTITRPTSCTHSVPTYPSETSQPRASTQTPVSGRSSTRSSPNPASPTP
jgi:hypothetical protein